MQLALLTSLRLRPTLRHRLRSSDSLALPAAGQPFLATLLLLLPLAGPVSHVPDVALSTGHTRQPSLQERAGADLPLPEIYSLTPERRALLNTIRYAEGTWLGGSLEGYRVLYGGGRFTGFARHPELEVRRRYVSAAAGAYQFLPMTWKATARELALQDFGPSSQDQAALHLVRRRGALDAFDREGLSVEVLAKLSPEWASLPSWNGGSAYGQPVRSASELQAFYQRELARQRELRPT